MIKIAATRENGTEILGTNKIQITPNHPLIGQYHSRWKMTTIDEAYETFCEMILSVLGSNLEIDIQDAEFEILVIESPSGRRYKRNKIN